MIPVNRPFLPPKREYVCYLDEIWERNWLTNNGPNVRLLEEKLQDYLGIGNKTVLVNNGTTALQIAIKALNLKGQIITTPFSYVATASSIVWENCEPIFADIDEETFNINVTSIEALINDNTVGIVGAHVFGNPCDIEAICRLADKHNLKVIFDAAHAFSVKYEGQSIFNYGDISIASLHSTKLYHCIEGGFVTTLDMNLIRKCELMRNFGHDGPYQFSDLGINGKNSEFHAAMGLINLEYIDQIIEKRKSLVDAYESLLSVLPITFQRWESGATRNYAYMPILFESEEHLLKTTSMLESKEIYTRRYFYPTLDKLPYLSISDRIPVAQDIAKRIICLPLYFDLSVSEVEMICEIIKFSLKHN
ncbi:DegT/DnrJ/EryC1/StrS family aminotransferase [Ekhidna sp.]|jgi:dTDP-4-amino-4,6-dideoxygalactose transaminase|uniref:DegT/DnrJ/EryC1/StrS family aminotransferase n=1 Tax=Ekhidna sp. TaxID=2608089 RepID=UPI0032EC784B